MMMIYQTKNYKLTEKKEIIMTCSKNKTIKNELAEQIAAKSAARVSLLTLSLLRRESLTNSVNTQTAALIDLSS